LFQNTQQNEQSSTQESVLKNNQEISTNNQYEFEFITNLLKFF
jgi:hypothetical protein